MKIMAVCGHGLGSSFMLEMNIQNVLNELNIEAEVSHATLIDVSPTDADIFVCGKDLVDAVSQLNNVVVLDSIIDVTELKDKLGNKLKEIA